MKKLWQYILAGLALIGTVIAVLMRSKKESSIIPGERAAERLKDDIKVIDEKIAEVKEGKIDKLSDDDEVDYWKFN